MKCVTFKLLPVGHLGENRGTISQGDEGRKSKDEVNTHLSTGITQT